YARARAPRRSPPRTAAPAPSLPGARSPPGGARAPPPRCGPACGRLRRETIRLPGSTTSVQRAVPRHWTGGAARVIGSRMRRRAGLLIAVACAACGGRGADVYPPEVVRNFMGACTARSEEGVCRCALDALERRFSVEQFLAFEARMRAGEMPKEMIAAVAGCGR